eukprot:scaffold4321_cov92-Amphora_coffeaeformis.AAC.1
MSRASDKGEAPKAIQEREREVTKTSAVEIRVPFIATNHFPCHPRFIGVQTESVTPFHESKIHASPTRM